VFENRVLRRTFAPQRGEVTEGWRKLYNDELHNLYSLININTVMKSRRIKHAGHVARMGETTKGHRISSGRSEGSRPLGRHR
jgi:hypothetical protein